MDGERVGVTLEKGEKNEYIVGTRGLGQDTCVSSNKYKEFPP